MSVRYKSSTIICLDVEPPVDDGGEHIIAYHVYYDQGKVLEFQTGMYVRTAYSVIDWLLHLKNCLVFEFTA